MRQILAVLLISSLLCPVPAQARDPIQDSKTQVYFDDEALQGILDIIDMTEYELRVQMYDFTGHEATEPIMQALELACQRGVNIKLYLDNRGSNNPDKPDGTGFPEARMELAGCEVHWEPGSKTMHRKIWASDRCTVFIGSTNISNNGLNRNDEVDIRLEDPMIVEKLVLRFEADWLDSNETFYGEED